MFSIYKRIDLAKKRLKDGDDALFEQYEFDTLKDDLSIPALAKMQARDNKPLSDAQGFDINEQKIVTFFTDRLSSVKQEIYKKVASYDHMAMRVSDITTILAEAKYASEEFVQNITTFQESAKQRIKEVKHEYSVRKADIEKFKTTNSITREASYPHSKILYIGIIMVILLSETSLNAYFFAKGNELGLIGGAAQALIVSLINIVFAFFLGGYLVKKLNLIKKAPVLKYGVLATLLGSFFMILLFNLLVGHLRVQLGLNADTAYVKAIETFMSNPFSLNEFDSIILVLVGLLSFLIAFTDFYKMDDEYPGYGALDRKYQDALMDFNELKEELLDEIEGSSKSILNKLETQQMTSKVIMQELMEVPIFRQKLQDHYKEYYNYLNNTCNAMLSLYREINNDNRTDAAPAYFRERMELDADHTIVIVDEQFKRELQEYQKSVLELPHIIGEQKLNINKTLRSVITELGSESDMELSNG